MNPVDTVLVPSRRVGRYFGLVSGVTSLIPVAFLWALTGSEALSGDPDIDSLRASVAAFGLSEVAVFAIGTLVVGVMLHPLQYGLTQLLEGYWGPSRFGRLAMARSALRHHDRWNRLQDLEEESDERAAEAADDHERFLERPEAEQDADEEDEILRRSLVAAIDNVEAGRALAFYPTAPGELMPTRLGNVLRRYETEGRNMFGLDPVVALPFAIELADDRVRAYIDDQRSAMDLSVRLTLIWTICTVLSVAALWDNGAWNLVTLACYGLILLSYRGSVRAATFYGSAITTVLVLNRMKLLRKMQLRQPADSECERAQFESLTSWLRSEKGAYLAYDADADRQASQGD